MFKRLREHWKVNNTDLLLILLTFAVTGTLTAYISKMITHWLKIERGSALGWGIRIAILVFGYQVIILIVGFLFGQFQFFWNYEKKILRRMGLMKKPWGVNVAIFASGAGSNAQKIIDHFKGHSSIHISLIVCNNPDAGVVGIAKKENIPILLIDRKKFGEDGYLDEIKSHNIRFIVLAGFLLKVPSNLVRAFSDRIINIHPALLPKYGGKNMYGARVHEAVIAAGDKESGITIHYVDEIYDHGKVIFCDKCVVEDSDTSDSLAVKVHVLEHLHYPRVVEEVILNS